MKHDVINYWSEVKLDIIKDYAKAYSTVICGQKKASLHHVYVDAFAGAGQHISKKTGEFVPGSPLNALNVNPPFKEHHLIDLDRDKAKNLSNLCRDCNDVSVYEGNCNDILLKQVFPKIRYEDYRRGLCLLDPYGLHLNWEVIQTAGKMKSMEIFLNFPVMDMNMNALWNNLDQANPTQVARMNAFWGDESWKEAVYQPDLFGDPMKAGNSNELISKAFQARLEDKNGAGFKYVPDPMPMRNKKNAIVYYLFFASHNDTGKGIVEQIFEKYRNRQGM